MTKKELVTHITVRVKGNGYVAELADSVFTEVKLDAHFLQIDKVRLNRRPIIDVMNSTDGGWNYRSRNGAVLALFLHCIMNLHLRHSDHWSMEYLKNAKEVLLLLPVTREQDTSAAVCVFYRGGADNRIWLRQITNHSKVLPPLVIAQDYNHFFSKRKNQNK